MASDVIEGYKWLKPRRLENGFVSVRIHYTAHPERRDPDWLKGVTQGMSPEDIQREYECKFIGGGQRVFPYEALFDADDVPILTSEYEPPMPNEGYVIGVDCSSGMSNGDFSCAIVIKVSSMTEVAHLHLRVKPQMFAEMLKQLGEKYNNALLAVELEKWGGIVLTRLQGLRYQNIYYTRRKKQLNRKRIRSSGDVDKWERIIGWQNDGQTKKEMILDLVDAVTARTIGIATPGTIMEMNTFQKDDRDRFRAASGCYDDRVMATGIAYVVAKNAPRTSAYTSKDILLGQELETNNSPAYFVQTFGNSAFGEFGRVDRD